MWNVRGKCQAFAKGITLNATLYASLLFSVVGVVNLIINIITKEDTTLGIYLSAVSATVAIVTLLLKISEYKKDEQYLYEVEKESYRQELLNIIKNEFSNPVDGFHLIQNLNKNFYYLNSPEVDDYLSKHVSDIQLVKEKYNYKLPLDLIPFVPYALKRKLNSSARFYNGHKIRLCSDLRPGIEQVKFQKTDYFSVFCTNDIVFKKIKSKFKLNQKFYGEKILFDEHQKLNGLSEGVLANNIGLSTLAFTSDGYLIIGRQGDRNNIGADKYVPSGSGSGDYDDSKKCKTFGEMLIKGINRELREECNISAKTKIETKIVGFIRIINRGGKPDFFGLSELHATKKDIEKCILTNKEIRRGYMKVPSFIYSGNQRNAISISKEMYQSISLQLDYYITKGILSISDKSSN